MGIFSESGIKCTRDKTDKSKAVCIEYERDKNGQKRAKATIVGVILPNGSLDIIDEDGPPSSTGRLKKHLTELSRMSMKKNGEF